jgi:hypothetical protein
MDIWAGTAVPTATNKEWEEKLDFLTYALEAIERKSLKLVQQLNTAESRADTYAARYARLLRKRF